MKDQILEKAKEVIRSIEPSADIFLFGSRARQDNRNDSDWDFLILVDGLVDTTRTDRIRHQLYEIEWETGEVISSIIKSRQDWNDPKYKAVPLYINIEREGIMI
jgi:predicted nucleotidyltransferase